MYKSCNYIKHGLCFFEGCVASCCLSPVDQINGQRPPMLYETFNGNISSKEDLFSRIHKYSDVFKNGGCPKECTNCCQIKEKDWDEEDYINTITITHFSICNADCIYCSNNKMRSERSNNVYKIVPVLDFMKDNGIIRQGVELHIGGGEFTIYGECEELLTKYALSNFAGVFVPTNGIKYSDILFRSMNEAKTYIFVSLDSGSRAMFKRIKRIDAFDGVVKNLEKYAATEKTKDVITLKYIILPTINDNLKEFSKFLDIAEKCGIRKIAIDIDARYSRLKNFNIDEYYILLAYRMKELAQKRGFAPEFYTFFEQNEETRKKSRKNNLPNLFTPLKMKYFNREIKELYNNHHYDILK